MVLQWWAPIHYERCRSVQSRIVLLQDKSIFSVKCRPFLPLFLQNGHMHVAIIVDFLRSAFASDTSDVLRKFAVERDGECKEQDFKIGDVSAFSQNLSCGDKR